MMTTNTWAETPTASLRSHILNDGYTARQLRDIALEVFEARWLKPLTDREAFITEVADKLKSEISEKVLDTVEETFTMARFVTETMRSTLDKVDWVAIAEATVTEMELPLLSADEMDELESSI